LKNLLERAVIICQGNELTPMHFTSVRVMKIPMHNANPYDLQELEKQTILNVLQRVNFNKSEAARLLNLDWNALYRRVQKYSIELPTNLSSG
jgi:DNA-binding NtrC family response regulator